MPNPLTLKERADAYNNTFPDYPPVHVFGRWLYGVWMIGNDYRNKTRYYGAYPRSYLKRIKSMFQDIREEDTLHLFSGSLDPKETKATYVDTNGMYPEVLKIDAHKISQHMTRTYKLILADPPYSEEDSKHYGTPFINRNKVVKECYKVLQKNGFLVWLDQVKPMYRKDYLHLFGTIGVDRSTNHRARMVYIFEKVSDSEWLIKKNKKITKKKRNKTLLEV